MCRFTAPISIPVWYPSTVLCVDSLAPNLDVIFPETGLISAIPKDTFCPDVVRDVLTAPDALTFVVAFAFATTTFGASYRLATAVSLSEKSFNSVYFCDYTLKISFLLEKT